MSPPAKVKNFTTIKIVITNGNIVFMPNNIGIKLPVLQFLGIISTNLKYLKKENFENLSMLRSLDLRKNQISELEDDVFTLLTSLMKINLSDNNLKKVPDTFKQMLYMQKFIANDNEIEVFDSNIFSQSIILQEIHLWSNNLKSIVIDISKKKLRIIDFRNNTCIDRLYYAISNVEHSNQYLDDIKNNCSISVSKK